MQETHGQDVHLPVHPKVHFASKPSTAKQSAPLPFLSPVEATCYALERQALQSSCPSWLRMYCSTHYDDMELTGLGGVVKFVANSSEEVFRTSTANEASYLHLQASSVLQLIMHMPAIIHHTRACQQMLSSSNHTVKHEPSLMPQIASSTETTLLISVEW